MPLPLRSLTNLSLSTLIGMGVLVFRTTSGGRVSAEQFEPIKEAEMPRGFPDYTAVGRIELKRYPAYRKASASGAAKFWTLFRHIKQNHFSMTAPVEMDYGDPHSEKLTERSMSFLYESPEQGIPGNHGSVYVNDLPAMAVVSIGCRGNQSPSAIAKARQQLMTYLAAKKDEYAIAGSMRVMGYNSPFVPRNKNFFEVQIPVKAAKVGEVDVEDGWQETDAK